ncbi:MAG: YajD family HNH nuclease [Desulfomonilia bacterium]|nr:YajD family HNH nuclease [Desulfomonilia bacterium]
MGYSSRPRKPGSTPASKEELDQVVARARRARQERMKGYREQCLRIHPWVCARCGRQFTPKNLHQLTVHHKDHNHDNNPPDGSNWENLCLYCHDNEHRRYLDHLAGDGAVVDDEKDEPVTHKPFAALAELLKDGKK